MSADDTEPSPKWWNSLLVRIVALLTISLLPIGLIAVVQTNQVARTSTEILDKIKLTITEQAAEALRIRVERAFGAARMLGALHEGGSLEPATCTRFLQSFLDDESDFSFVGVIPLDGLMTCSSTGESRDFSGTAEFERRMANPESVVSVNTAGPLSKTSVIVVALPYEVAGAFGGYVSVSIPHTSLADDLELSDATLGALKELITLNEDGDILTASVDMEAASVLAPQGMSFQDIFEGDARVFRGTAGDGENYSYSVVPSQNAPITVLGVWRPNTAFTTTAAVSVPTWVFPALMWAAALIAMFAALYSLVIRQVATLKTEMDAFAETRKIPDDSGSERTPTEFVDLKARFLDMTDQILREEARLESHLREKNVLLKEIHHRVKNNLQMIASIMNMQIRNAEHDETVENLQRIQGRVTDMASIHTDLYTSPDEGRVNVGELIANTVSKSTSLSDIDPDDIVVTTEVTAILLYPDQTVPLSLLAAEVVTNAVKYLGKAEDGKAYLTVKLQEDDGQCLLSVRNSVRRDAPHEEPAGVGSKLIRVFAIKLGAEVDTTEEDDSYTVAISFPIETFQPDIVDF